MYRQFILLVFGFCFVLVYIVFEASVTFGSEGEKGMWQIANS